MAEEEVRLRYSGVVLFLSRLLSVGTGLLFSLMVARNTTELEFGIYGNLGDTLSYFTLSALIIPFWTTRFTARNHAGAPKTGLTANLLLSTMVAASYALLLSTITSALQIGEAYIIVYTIAVIQIVELYTLHAFEAILQAKQPQKIGYGFLTFEVCKVIIGYMLIMQVGLGLFGAVASVIFAYAIQLTFYMKLTGHEFQGKIRWDYVKEWFKASPINLYNVVGQRLATFVLILLFVYAGQLARAYYGAALTIASIVGYSSIMAFALYPKLLSKSDPEDISISLKMVLMFIIPMTAGAIILSDSYLTILKSIYRLARPVLIPLVLNALCVGLSSVFNTIVLGTEKLDAKAKIPFKKLVKSRIFLVFTLPYIQAAVAIPTTYFVLTFIAETAVEAAAFLASIILATNIAALLVNYAIAKKCLNFSIPWRNMAKYAGATAVMTMVLLVLPHPTRLSLTLALTLLGGIIYLAVLLPTDKEARSLVNSIIQEILGMTRPQKRQE